MTSNYKLINRKSTDPKISFTKLFNSIFLENLAQYQKARKRFKAFSKKIENHHKKAKLSKKLSL